MGEGRVGGLLLFLLHWEVCFDYGTSWGKSRLMFTFKLILKKTIKEKTIRSGIIKLMLRYSNLSFGSWTLATCEWLLLPSTSQDRLPCIFWRTLQPLKIKIQAARYINDTSFVYLEILTWFCTTMRTRTFVLHVVFLLVDNNTSYITDNLLKKVSRRDFVGSWNNFARKGRGTGEKNVKRRSLCQYKF